MKKILLFCLAGLSACIAAAQSHSLALIPLPNQLEISEKAPFRVTEGKTAIVLSDSTLNFEAQELSKIFSHRMQVKIPVQTVPSKRAIHLTVDPQLQEREHYVLEVSAQDINLRGATAEAVYRGIMTLDQWLLGEESAVSRHEVPSVQIDDKPRLGYRALMLDPARHFLPVEDIKFYIDQMAKFKYNMLQLHLTDDQGWRVEIKSQPRLASQQHYTQEQLRELIRYAALRHIRIVPEIDVPGHTVAILSAYPQLACQHLQGQQVEVGKTVNRMLCAANPETYKVLGDVFTEICALFDAPYVHLGGDEVAVPANWAKCPKCKEMMRRLGYEKATQLMAPFFDKVLSFVRKGGKRPVLWCELNNIYPPASDYLFPYPEDVVLVSWRNGLTPTCLSLTGKSGHSILLAPGEHAYFDYPQWKGDLPEYNNWGMPVTTLRQTYALDPGYGLPPSGQQHILGVMGTLWGEAISDINRATYMTYPRGLALAEAGWTQLSGRSWESFRQRLYPNLLSLMKSGVSVRAPFEIAR